MKSRKSSSIAVCALVLTIPLMGARVSAQSICEGPKGCTSDQFAAEAVWIAQEQIDQAQNNSKEEGLRLSTCVLYTTSDIAGGLFSGKNGKVSQDQYRKWMTNLKEHLKGAPQWYKENCERSMTVDQYSNLLAAIVGTQRQKTKLNSILSDPEAYRGKTFRVDGYGLQVMNTLYLKSAPDDMNPIAVHLEDVKKGDRETLITNCGKATSLCKLTLWGRTKSSEPLVTVTMTRSIEWHSGR